jgi:hypothetical protein
MDRAVLGILRALSTHFDRNALEGLRGRKRRRHFYRLALPKNVQYEFRGQFGHPSSYASVRLGCIPADDLSFSVCAAWPATVTEDYQAELELAIAESIADSLLDGLYQHTGCALTLSDVRYDEIGSSAASFMRATKGAIEELLTADWTLVTRQP